MSVETEPFLTLWGWALPSIQQSWKCLSCLSVLGDSSPGQCSLCTLPSKACKHKFFISLGLFPRHQTSAWPCSWSLPQLLIGFPCRNVNVGNDLWDHGLQANRLSRGSAAAVQVFNAQGCSFCSWPLPPSLRTLICSCDKPGCRYLQ